MQIVYILHTIPNKSWIGNCGIQNPMLFFRVKVEVEYPSTIIDFIFFCSGFKEKLKFLTSSSGQERMIEFQRIHIQQKTNT